VTGTSTARAVWFRAPFDVAIDDVDVRPPADGELLVRTLYSGISAGTELLAFRGELDPDLAVDETIGALGGTFRYPFRFGYSAVGIVEATRSAIAEGTTVFAFHPHQTRFVAAADDVVVLGDVAARTATLFPLVETALQITLDAGNRFGEPVVVFGLGPVGLLSAMLLQRAGACVVAAEPRPWRREAAAEFGIDAFEPADIPSVAGRVSLAIEASGSPRALVDALAQLDHEGTVLVASWYGAKPVSLPLGGRFHRRRLTIRSTQVSTIPAHLADRWTVSRRRATVASLLAQLDLDALATHTFAFDEAPKAYAEVDAGAEGLIHAALWYDVADA
jgi:2-desacetyl-2-hydroxyethyl bacteriochlorophyllide A dehydrogenase